MHRTQPTKAFTPELAVESVTLLAVRYYYGGAWALPPAGLPPAGTAAIFAAQEAVGERTADALMEEHKEQCRTDSFIG